MKIRTGFVSNSSSSSFLLYIKTKDTKEDIITNNKKMLIKAYGKEYFTEYKEDHNKDRDVESSMKLVYTGSAEYGSDTIETVRDILKALSYSSNDYKIEVSD